MKHSSGIYKKKKIIQYLHFGGGIWSSFNYSLTFCHFFMTSSPFISKFCKSMPLFYIVRNVLDTVPDNVGRLRGGGGGHFYITHFYNKHIGIFIKIEDHFQCNAMIRKANISSKIFRFFCA